MGAVVTLTTDFGLTDAYVAAVKGVILSINPEATLVDICHQIQPQNIRQAAFVLSTAWQYFPYQTVHLVVVDPGVGTERRPIILKTPRAYFVAPDNGVLSYVLSAFPHETLPNSRRVVPGPEVKVYVITKSEYWRQPVSRTFHARDIFAPVAARLSLGMPPSGLGDAVDTVTVFDIPHPVRRGDTLTGHILHIDNFGNLITDVRSSDLSGMEQSINIVIGNRTIRGLSTTYAEGEGLEALLGSSDYLEISLKNASASEFLHARIGDEIIISSGGRL